MMVYEANYANGEKTVTHNFEDIVLFVRDTKVKAEVTAWMGGNPVAHFSIDAPKKN